MGIVDSTACVYECVVGTLYKFSEAAYPISVKCTTNIQAEGEEEIPRNYNVLCVLEVCTAGIYIWT